MADPVYLATTEFPGTGAAAPTLVDFNFSGGYIDRSHVKVELFDTSTFAITQVPVDPAYFVTDWRLELPVSVPVGTILRVYRDTPKDAPLANFTTGARITEGNLDLISQQAVFVAAESQDRLATAGVPEALAASASAGASAAAAATRAADAQTSQIVAGTAAISAGNSAASAASSASTAASSAATANSAATAADASATTAGVYAAQAVASASLAADEAYTAGIQKVLAVDARTTAQNAASAASNSATSASTQATAAASSASAASTSASNAAAAAAAAAASAVAADTSADLAAASAASIDAANLVHKTGDEAISGVKTFASGSIIGRASAGSANAIVTGYMADSDVARILVGGASNVGYLELATADDGTEPIIARQYTGPGFNTAIRTFVVLDANGETWVPGTLNVQGPRIYHHTPNFVAELGAGPGTGDQNKYGLYVPAGKSLYLAGNAGGAAIEIGPSGVTFFGTLTLPGAPVLAVTAGTGANSVGMTGFHYNASGSTHNPGDVVAGSGLRFSAGDGTNNGGAPSGTWRCMGYAPNGKSTEYVRTT